MQIPDFSPCGETASRRRATVTAAAQQIVEGYRRCVAPFCAAPRALSSAYFRDRHDKLTVAMTKLTVSRRHRSGLSGRDESSLRRTRAADRRSQQQRAHRPLFRVLSREGRRSFRPLRTSGANIGRQRRADRVYLAYVRRLSSHFDLELTPGYPPLQKTVGNGPSTMARYLCTDRVIATAVGH